MLRKLLIILLVFQFTACAGLQQVVDYIPLPTTVGLPNTDIASGLREALNVGIEKQVGKLTQQDGFFKNHLARGVEESR